MVVEAAAVVGGERGRDVTLADPTTLRPAVVEFVGVDTCHAVGDGAASGAGCPVGVLVEPFERGADMGIGGQAFVGSGRVGWGDADQLGEAAALDGRGLPQCGVEELLHLRLRAHGRLWCQAATVRALTPRCRAKPSWLRRNAA